MERDDLVQRVAEGLFEKHYDPYGGARKPDHVAQQCFDAAEAFVDEACRRAPKTKTNRQRKTVTA